jgi:hypothetical protein
MTEEQKLAKMISNKLDEACNEGLPRLCKYIESKGGRETAENMIYNMCATSGISIQTAMSTLNSDL